MSVYQALMLMISFAMLVLAIVSLRQCKNHSVSLATKERFLILINYLFL
ncbi:putative holin-like toxin [Aminipila sp.]